MHFSNTPRLETERLILRKFTEKDVDALFELLSDAEVNRFLPWFPMENEARTRAFYQENFLKCYQSGQSYKYAVCLKTDDKAIGYVHASLDDSHDFGYALKKEFWHQGIISEAAKKVIEQLRADGFDYITATHDVNNPRSGAVMKAVGMQYKYSYTELWQPKNFNVTFRMYQLNFDGNDDRVYQKYMNKYGGFVEKDV